MRITATQIEQWADTREAQGLLPILVRRLISATTSATKLAIRGGDSVNMPGWDGSLNINVGNAWVPVGQSRWEMGCSEKVDSKAAQDFETRTKSTAREVASKMDFIFVSPRRWAGKETWRETAAGAKHWREVRVYDADDLEAWLETAPGVELWFREVLGLAGPGVQSIQSYWETWRSQTKKPITVEAISAGRQARVDALREALSKAPALLVIEADSTEEAVAFTCAELLALGHAESAACITTREGWHYVDKNPQLRILVAGSPEVAVVRAAKDGATLIVPVNIGDRPDHFSPLAAQAAGQALILERPDAEHFEKALVALGEDEADAARYTRSTGRSWSVYRRMSAANPSISHPTWMNNPSARALTAIVLVGGWDERRPGDVACLEAVTGKPYSELERDLLHLARQDDPPVLKIGSVWKAKAPLELLYLYAKEITGDELKSFFATAEAILTKPDPALDLHPDKRWMASVYGKVRDESGIVINSIVDSLAKLSFYAENNRDERIATGVAGLVRTLLHDVDGDRWLSLSDVLRELAEAAPEAFLDAVEESLQRKDAPIRRLFTEHGGDNVFGRNWHADLLWALETLAWSPRHLGRVTDILAHLVSSPVPKNWGNRPENSLSSVLRPWWPQTTAGPDQCLACVDRLIERHNDVAWDLLVALMPKHQSFVTPNAKPHWRDDDAGAPTPNSTEGFGEYLSQLGARIVEQARGKPERIAELVQDLDGFGGQYRAQIIRLVETSLGFPDDDREVIRSALRKYVSWHNSYNREGGKRSRAAADRLRKQFDALAPASASKRHAWLFENGWVELPDGRDDDYKKQDADRERLRKQAVREVLAEEGWAGLTKLGHLAGHKFIVGWEVANAGFDESDLLAWVLALFADSGEAWHHELISGVLHGLDPVKRGSFLAAATAGLSPVSKAAFVSAAPCIRETWEFLESCSQDAREAYWKTIRPGVIRAEHEDLCYAVNRLIEVNRHRTAFVASYIEFKKGDAAQMLTLLEGIAAGAEPEGPLPDAWRIGEAIEAITKAGAANRRQLALLEFKFFRALEHGKGAKVLYDEMLNDPTLFMECVCLVFKPHSGTSEPLDEARKAAAELGWSVLHHGRGVPGSRADGSIDRVKFDAWIDAARKSAAENDRLRVTDSIIGEWLSTCPADPDGKWPCAAVRDLLEQADADSIRSGFHCGVRNNRGVHSRAMGAGGDQERDLAARYRSMAEPLRGSHPRTAAVLESIAGSYDSDARWHDDDAKLLKEGAR